VRLVLLPLPSLLVRVGEYAAVQLSSAQHRAEYTSSAQRHITDFDLLGLCECAGGARQTLQQVKRLAGACVPQANGFVV
jgi:hypothetical protein